MRLATCSTILGLSALALAQTPDNLIALTRLTPAIGQRNHAACALLPFCAPAGFPPAFAQPYAGGTAWDPIRNGVWICNGQVIAEVDPDTCAYLCPPSVTPLVTPNAVVTGLEFCESINQLWQLDSLGNLYRLAYACPPTVISICNTGLGLTATNATGGLAVDEVNRLVFYSYSNWMAAVPATTIHVATMANPCVIIQTLNAPACAGAALRAVTGLAVDGVRRILYLTDGVTTVAGAYNVLPGPMVNFIGQSCCTLAPPVAGDTYVGLAVRSGRATTFGPPCASGTCPVCPMVHTLANSPNLGNLLFSLSLNNAPKGALSWCNIGVGPCGPGAAFPPLCGPLFTGPSLGVIGMVPTTPGAGCGGSASYPLPLPMIPGLGGLVLSSQCIVFCPIAPGFGTSLSNCLSWQIQSN
jgi:hypothetical protein